MKTLEQMHQSRKRWMTRLVRATHEVAKLDNKIYRANGKLKATIAPLAEGKVRKGGINPPPAADFERPAPPPAFKPLDIPTVLVRTEEPQLVDQLKAKRKSVDKTAMPLNEKDARAYIAAKSEEVTARRKKRKLT